MRIKSVESLKTAAEKARSRRKKIKTEILVCAGTGCLANGSLEVVQSFERTIQRRKLDTDLKIDLKTTGCHGFCEQGPLVVIQPEGIFYRGVKPDDVKEIVETTLIKGEIVERLLYRDPNTKKRVEHYTEIPFYDKQLRIALRNIGKIDPGHIDDYIAVGGYAGLAKALAEMTPEQVIETVIASKLAGAGVAVSQPGASGRLAETLPLKPDMSCATLTRGIPVPSWTGAFAKGTPMR